jgi:serine/threonine-protein kinase
MPNSTERLTAALEGRYRVLRRIGEGGMALVYLAEDLKHHRQVALKILRPELAASLGPQRFLREIQIAARLTHPNILPLLDSGDADGTLFYVMPFVEGESLRERLVREGQLPVDEAVKLTQRVATALGYAHSLGVVHRDIKPENILLSGGEPVVTDFGIAKAVSEAGQTNLTESGFAIGTAPYMSPEQSGGERQLDGRSDLYSLGCVLYEMLAGAPPFVGPTLHAITARKLTEPAPPLRTVRDTVPAALEHVVFKVLARLPADRYATGLQLAEALEAARTSAITPSAPVPAAMMAPSSWRARLPWAVAGAAVVIAAALGWLGWRSRAGTGDLRLAVTTPRGTELYGYSSPVALSPDGATLVFAAGRGDSVRLYARRLDGYATRPLPGTEGGDSPFFSPDGRWVGFFARKARQLRKIALDGVSPITVAEDLAVDPYCGVWAPNDTIYFANWPDQQVSKVAARGGAVRTVTHGPPPMSGWFRYPEAVLPDGRHALVTVEGAQSYRVDVVSLETGEHQPLLEKAANARVVGRFLLYVPQGRPEIVAVRFDLEKLKVSGDPVTVLDSVATAPGWPQGYFAVAANGTLAYVPLSRWLDPDVAPNLALVGRDGTEEPRHLPQGASPRFSPDGRRILHMGFGRHGPSIFAYNLASGADVRLTSHEGEGYEGWPLLSPDGRSVIYNCCSDRRGYLVLYSTPADGSGHPVRLPTDSTMHQQPFAWAAGGAELLYTRGPGATGMDIWALPMHGGGTARPLMQTAANETQPALSPDGRWMAWMTDASGRREVMVRRYPDGPSVPVSREGGVEPAWGPGGRELYFRDIRGTSVMVASFQPGEPPVVGAPRVLFTGPYQNCLIWCRAYDVSPDGRRFVMVKNFEGMTQSGYWPSGSEIRIIPRWDRELERVMRGGGRTTH